MALHTLGRVMSSVATTKVDIVYASSNDSLSLRYFSQRQPLTVPCDQEEVRSLQKFDPCQWFREIVTIM